MPAMKAMKAAAAPKAMKAREATEIHQASVHLPTEHSPRGLLKSAVSTAVQGLVHRVLLTTAIPATSSDSRPMVDTINDSSNLVIDDHAPNEDRHFDGPSLTHLHAAQIFEQPEVQGQVLLLLLVEMQKEMAGLRQHLKDIQSKIASGETHIKNSKSQLKGSDGDQRSAASIKPQHTSYREPFVTLVLEVQRSAFDEQSFPGMACIEADMRSKVAGVVGHEHSQFDGPKVYRDELGEVSHVQALVRVPRSLETAMLSSAPTDSKVLVKEFLTASSTKRFRFSWYKNASYEEAARRYLELPQHLVLGLAYGKGQFGVRYAISKATDLGDDHHPVASRCNRADCNSTVGTSTVDMHASTGVSNTFETKTSRSTPASDSTVGTSTVDKLSMTGVSTSFETTTSTPAEGPGSFDANLPGLNEFPAVGSSTPTKPINLFRGGALAMTEEAEEQNPLDQPLGLTCLICGVNATNTSQACIHMLEQE